jgi:hypothetical protein
VYLDRDCGEDLLAAGASATQAGFVTADVRLIHLDGAGQSVTAGTHEGRA